MIASNAFRLAALCLLITLSGLSACGEKSGGNPSTGGAGSSLPDGTKNKPLRVLLIPADGGTEQGTRADYEPVFNAITKTHGLHFEIRVAQTYQSVVEGMINDKVEIAFVGAVTYHQAHSAGAAELLAVAVTGGESVYYSGIFCRNDSGIQTPADLKGKTLALGDVNSTSSFHFPLAMIMAAGLDPANDLKKVLLTGSHANALAALSGGQVDAAACAFNSYEKAVTSGQIDPNKIKLLAKSEPIPYPPLVMHRKLSPELKKQLRDAFETIHQQPDVKPDMIRGYGGKKVDRYDTKYPESQFDAAMGKLAKVTDELKEALIKKAAE